MLEINNNNVGLERRIIQREVHKAHGHIDGVNVSLPSHIMDDHTHQITIYECLNVDEVGRLFESLHDPNKKHTANISSLHLQTGPREPLYPGVLAAETALRSACFPPFSPTTLPADRPPILPSSPDNLLRNPCSHTDLVKLLKHLKFQKDALCWHINLANMGYMLDPHHNYRSHWDNWRRKDTFMGNYCESYWSASPALILDRDHHVLQISCGISPVQFFHPRQFRKTKKSKCWTKYLWCRTLWELYPSFWH